MGPAPPLSAAGRPPRRASCSRAPRPCRRRWPSSRPRSARRRSVSSATASSRCPGRPPTSSARSRRRPSRPESHRPLPDAAPIRAVQEALYPLRPSLDPVSRFFLDPDRRDDDALVGEAARRRSPRRPRARRRARLRQRAGRARRVLAVRPGAWDGATRCRWWWRCTAAPATAGTSCGAGCATRAPAASSSLSPTARDRTWSILGGPDVDAEPLDRMVHRGGALRRRPRARPPHRHVRRRHVRAPLRPPRRSPFTHLAPVCGVLHPILLADGRIERARGRPIYLVARRARLDVPRPVRPPGQGRAQHAGGRR